MEFSGLPTFDKVVLQSKQSFEIDNVSAGNVHAELAAPMTGTLTVSDADIGDTLTAAVTSDAAVTYNGVATLPTNVDMRGLIAANAITFDSVTSDSHPQVLDWIYRPTNPDLDFLKPGDILPLNYTVQISDGHGSVSGRPLTITLVGAAPGANMAAYQVVSGTAQDDTFHNVGNGVTIFGGGGSNTFIFEPGFHIIARQSLISTSIATR